MNGLTDALVIGIVLTLVFAAVSYYLYSRTIQLEKKVGLMETILLDLKVQTEQALEAEPERDEEEDLTQYKQIVQSAISEPKERTVDRKTERASSKKKESRVVVKREGLSDSESDSESETETDAAPAPAPAPAPSASAADSVKAAEEILQKFVDARMNRPVSLQGHIDYNIMNYRDLVRMSQHMGLSGATHMRKDEVIRMIKSARGELTEQQGTPLEESEEEEAGGDAREEIDLSFVEESE